MALGSTQPLTEMSTRSISWGQRRPVRKADNLPPSSAVVTKSGNLNFLEPSGPVQACNGAALPFYLSRDLSVLFSVLRSGLPLIFRVFYWTFLRISHLPRNFYTLHLILFYLLNLNTLTEIWEVMNFVILLLPTSCLGVNILVITTTPCLRQYFPLVMRKESEE